MSHFTSQMKPTSGPKLHFEKLSMIGKSFSYSLAAWLLAFFDQESTWSESYKVGLNRKYLEDQIILACQQYEQEILQKQQIQCQLKENEQKEEFESKYLRKDKRLSEIEHVRLEKRTERSRQASEDPIIVKLYTTYEAIQHLTFTSFEDPIQKRKYQIMLTDSQEDADFLFLTSQIKDFYGFPVHQRLNQVPYESAIVRKDIIPLTVREFSYNAKEGKLPDWWLPCYDLSTEFHLFTQEFQRRCDENSQLLEEKKEFEKKAKLDGQDKKWNRPFVTNQWFVKPCGGTRALGHRILTQEPTTSSLEGLHHAAVLAPMLNSKQIATLLSQENLQMNEPERFCESMSQLLRCSYLPNDEGRDRVAQLLVEYPLLMKNRKFDMRYYVLIRSFYPFEAYLHQLRYARLANKEYQPDQLYDQEVVMSVTCHHDDEEIANKQERVLYLEMDQELIKQYGEETLNLPKMHKKVEELMSEFFGNAGRSIGQWPNSSAYYAVDIIFDAEQIVFPHLAPPQEGALVPQPKLLEVSFLGDWHGVEAAVEHQYPEMYQHFANDVLLTLATDCDLSTHPRLTRL